MTKIDTGSKFMMAAAAILKTYINRRKTCKCNKTTNIIDKNYNYTILP